MLQIGCPNSRLSKNDCSPKGVYRNPTKDILFNSNRDNLFSCGKIIHL